MAERNVGNHRRGKETDGETHVSEARVAAASSSEKEIAGLLDRQTSELGRLEGSPGGLRFGAEWKAAERP